MRERIYKTSLFALVLACATAMPGDAAVKTKNSNRSYASGYQQVNAMRYQQEYMDTASYATTASATANLPVTVDDQNLANAILNNESTVNVSELEACSMIYPNGVFKWGIPESGVRKNPTSQCVAVVELRDVKTNAVLATTTLAAGDMMKCNVDSFPESGMIADLRFGKIEVPADAMPTEEDVIAVMNEEQKQNAGLKIAAGAIIAGVAGNLLAPKEAGAKQGKIPLGTGATQLRDTAIGAAAGAGIMAASTYSGKLAGDTIKSTAVNAASGMLVGNMLAGANGGDSIVATTKCTIGNSKAEYDCIIGNIEQISDETDWQESGKVYLTSGENAPVLECTEENDNLTNCSPVPNLRLLDIKVEAEDNKDPFLLKDVLKNESDKLAKTVRYTSNNSEKNFEKYTSGDYGKFYFKIVDGTKTTGKKTRAYAVFVNGALPKKAFGLKTEDIDFTKANFYYRNSDGTVGEKIADGNDSKNRFTASSRDAEDGGLIDLSNEARAKGTIVGTAAGGALGGFAGYQGAKDEVTERLLAAQREYEDSLTNFVCMTGARYLAPYNSYAEIPDFKKPEQ